MTSTKISKTPEPQLKERDGLPLWRQIISLFGWTRDSKILLSVFLLTIGLILYVWWPLAEEVLSYIDWTGPWWLYMDWLLIGIFLFMSIAIVSRANLGLDSLTILVATFGGLAIESWGTQTNLWHYYTAERPPLWIIPAWPIATLTINRMVRLISMLTTKAQSSQSFWFLKAKNLRALRVFVLNFLNTKVTKNHKGKALQPLSGDEAMRSRSRRAASLNTPSFTHTGTGDYRFKSNRLPLRNWQLSFILKTAYWLLFTSFFALMLFFVAPTFDKSYTLLSLLLVALLILTPTNYRIALLTFIAGAGLGYFLELWGTTRECWTYYTFQKPPLFAVLAHGMAAVAFWRTELLVNLVWGKIKTSPISAEKVTGD